MLADRISDISASILYISEDKHCLEYAFCYYEEKETNLLGECMKVMLKNIVYKSVGVLLSMAMLCGCAAQGNNGAIGGDDGISASSISASNASVSSTEVSVTLLSEDVTEESVNKVRDAWQRLSEVVPFSDIEFAIGPATKHIKRDGIVNFTEREISKDDFYEIFTERCTDLTYWKTVGLSEYAFDYTPINTEDEVKEYLEKREEKTLPLFALFFFEKFSEKSDLQMSRDLAYYLTKYALEKYSYNDFSANEYRSEWLTSIGATGDFRFDEIDEAIEASTAVKNGTAVYVKCAGNTWEIRNVEWLKTADEVYTVLYETEEGIQKLCKRIAVESDIVDEESFRKDVTVIPTDQTKMSKAENGVIELANPLHFIHEYVHCTLSYSYEEMWLVDGLAEYYSLEYKDDYTYNHNNWSDRKRKWFDEGIMDEESRAEIEQAGAMEYEETVRDNYLILKEKDKEKNKQNSCFAYGEGIAYLTFFGSDMRDTLVAYTGTIKDVYHNEQGIELADRLGNELGYNAAMLITTDLIAEYGVDSIISSSGSFEEDFGMTSDEYIQNYIDNKLYMHFIEE